MEKQGSQFSDTMRHMTNILETTFGIINVYSVFVWFCFLFCLGLHMFCLGLHVFFVWHTFKPIRYDEAKGDAVILEQMIEGQKPRFKPGSTSHPAAVHRD
jgi:hypothetical protein